MTYQEADYLQLSGIQHFRFCRRQWALIHIEDQWVENYRTVDGTLMHQNAHDKGFQESRGDLLITRGMSVFSPTLGVSGQCDVVEFHRDPAGISLHGRSGTWQPYPVEYKRGRPKADRADELQLCGQAMCLEEMLCCTMPEGALYYGETRHRMTVLFTVELRREVQDCLRELPSLYQKHHTPRVKPTKACNACSLKDLCLPGLMRVKPASEYLQDALKEIP